MSEHDTVAAAVDAASKASGSIAKLAANVGAAASAPSMWKVRGAVPPQYAVDVESFAHRHESGLWVRRWHLRPADWYRIWPELIGAEGAPGVSVRARSPESVAKHQEADRAAA